MVRIHDALDTATFDSSSTSGASQQDEPLGQAAFDLHMHDMPLEQEQQGGAGPSDAFASADSEDPFDSVNQKPEMKLVVISNRIAPFDPNQPQTGGLAAGLEPVVERYGAVWMGSSENRGDGSEQPLRLVKTGAGDVARLDLPEADYPGCR
ncbi:hypothetical protein XI06_24670 [Bradyrhizobium sp. CCBAU 11434]|uniref:hypothetical protein n=1 Tax=Bradyrhizobium sp. CCBAU 11434 TaxID=1630885 RepID=UPI0023056F25|nr:hypothetical protein [Bradyrhizobium sp. CCBAU 11434]MDA9523387.1 hypothetical protein [Bradyrhizobium sp. CCBAU 11434]